MVPLTLYSSDGFAEVVTVLVPDWRSPPDGYVWGSRHFIKKSVPAYGERYCEGFVFAIPVT